MSVTPGPLTLFRQWNAARGNLELAVSSFNDASRALGTIDVTRESALKTIEAELPLLEHERESLLESFIILKRLRNSAVHVWVNRFPREILATIFAFAVKGTPLDRWFPTTPSLDRFSSVLASVCWHWRCVSISTPGLWSQINLDPRPGMNYQTIWLARSAGCPLDFYFCARNLVLPDLSKAALDLYRLHYGRVRSLILNVGHFFGQDLLADACSSCPSSPLNFRILDITTLGMPALDMAGSKAMYGPQLDVFLAPISSLHISYVTLGTWASTAFSNLVDLRLEGIAKNEVPSYDHLTQILLSSPNLHSLNLSGFWMPPPPPAKVAPIVLENLAMVSLMRVPACFVDWLIKHIIPQPAGLTIEIGGPRGAVMTDIGLDLPFCAPTRIKALCLNNPCELRLDIGKLLGQLPSLEILGLKHARIREIISVPYAGVGPRARKLRILELVDSLVVDPYPLQAALACHPVDELWISKCECAPSAKTLRKELPETVVRGRPKNFMQHAKLFRR